jgi:uncharacterized protein (DUF1330 family)
MSAYLVFTREKMLDAHEMATYSKEVPATLTGHPVKILALYGAQEDLEGPPTGRHGNSRVPQRGCRKGVV